VSSARKPNKNKSKIDRSSERGRNEERIYERGREKNRGSSHDEDHERHRHQHRAGHGLRHDPGRFFVQSSANPAERAMGALMTTAKMIHRFRESKISNHKKFNKLSGPRMGVLITVHHAGGIRMGDLATQLGVAPRTVTDLVDGLERDGFLHRVPDPSDRRASILELSTLAKKDFELLASMRSEFVEEIFSPLNNEEKEALVSLLNKLCQGPLREIFSEDMDKFRRK